VGVIRLVRQAARTGIEYRIGMEGENILETEIAKRCVMMFEEDVKKGRASNSMTNFFSTFILGHF
jgi:hypothetical protein